MKQVERMHDSDARAAEAESEESRLLLERNVKTESQPPQLWLQPQRSWTTVCVSGMTRNTTQSYYSSRMNRQRSCARTHTQYWRYRKVQIRRTKCTFSFFFSTADTNIWTHSFNIRASWESQGLGFFLFFFPSPTANACAGVYIQMSFSCTTL